MEPVTAGSLQVWRDRERLRDLVVDANDGIVAIAGVVEGVLGAGLGGRSAATAVLMATIAGGIALGGSKYTEIAAERDARDMLIDVPLGRAVARNVAVGLTSMAVAYAVGSLVDA